jgi:hypothetical protein
VKAGRAGVHKPREGGLCAGVHECRAWRALVVSRSYCSCCRKHAPYRAAKIPLLVIRARTATTLLLFVGARADQNSDDEHTLVALISSHQLGAARRRRPRPAPLRCT